MLTTKHYGLTAFQAGDLYVGAIDKQRMSIIDNSMNFIASEIGDGIINGWEISQYDGLTMRIQPGSGLIGTIFTQTHGYIDFDLTNNNQWYVYLLRRPNVIGWYGPPCSPQKISYVDSSIPANITGLSVNPNSPITYNSISLVWNALTTPNINFYTIYRNNSLIATSEVANYTDLNVTPNTNYTYYVTATNFTGNTGANPPPSGGFLVISTLENLTQPNDPLNVQIYPGNGFLQIFWNTAIGGNINHYQITIQPIDNDGNNDGSPITITQPSTSIQNTITGLTNGQNYNITINSVSASGVFSNGISLTGTPAFCPGPPEIEDLILTDFQINSHVGINATWSTESDPYNLPAIYYIVTVTPQKGSASKPSVYYTTTNNISITAFTDTNDIILSFQETTGYFIRIQGVNATGNTNIGVLGEIITTKYSLPMPVSSLTVTQPNPLVVIANWTNSVSEFAYNEISVSCTNLTTNTSTVIVSNLNIGAENSYTVPQTYINSPVEFNFTIITVDNYENQSDPQTTAFTITTAITYTDRPPVPLYQDASGQDGAVIIRWSNPNTSNILGSLASYRIYRGPFAAKYTASSFISSSYISGDPSHPAYIGESPYGTYEFIDFEVTNATRYVYFVTSVTMSGVESLNPSQDGYFAYPLITARPANYSGLTVPSGLTITQGTMVSNNFVSNSTGTDIKLSWLLSQNSFDGYQILRSSGGNYDFQVIGTTDPATNTFIDTNALIASSIYFYIIRKYKNEADIFTTTGLIAPSNSLLVGVVNIANGQVTVNQNPESLGGPLVYIQNLADPIWSKTFQALDVPHHLYISDTDDRRINLSSFLTIDDWTTKNYITYTTAINIAYTAGEAYIVYINGQQSQILSQLDVTTGKLVFQTAIYSPSSSSSSGSGTVNPPTISVIFPNISEVAGTLPISSVSGISAIQIAQGKVETDFLPSINHQGRIGETLVPSTLTPTTPNNYIFILPSMVGTATTFYSVISLVDDPTNFFAATSNGILQSSNAGTEWNVVFAINEPIIRMFYSSGYYFAITPSTIYQGTSSVNSWIIITGLTGVNSIRDIIDNDGTIYVSTDRGVFYYAPNEYTLPQWSQCGLFDFNSTNTYALLYTAGILSVSTDNGLYCSTNKGQTWTKSTDFIEMAPIWAFASIGTTKFMISKDRLWRKKATDSTYNEIAVFAPTFARKMVSINNTLFISTNNGILINSSTNDIINDTTVLLIPSFQVLQRNGNIPNATSLDINNGTLYIGTEQMLYSASASGQVNLIAEYPNTIIPTIYVNNIETQLGVYYQGTAIYFDEQQSPNNIITIVNNYSSFTAVSGGWANTNYRATINAYVNNNIYTGATVTPNYATIGNMILPSLSPRACNMPNAIAALNNLVPYLNGFVSRANQQQQTTTPVVVTPEAISQLCAYVEALRATLYPSLQSRLIIPAITATFNRVSPTTDATDHLQITITCNVVDGTFSVTPQLDKYDSITIDVIAVPIFNQGTNTHWQLENAFETVNSGLPSRLSRTVQSNVLKMGIYNERMYPGGQNIVSIPFQANYITPCSTGWYDKINSTVDYNIQYESDINGLDIPYAATVIASLNGVWVGGIGGIVSINSNTNEIDMIPFPTDIQIIVYSMYYDGVSTTYILTNDGLYVSIDGIISKDTNINIPNNANVLLFIRNSYIISTPTGIYTHRIYDPSWTQSLNIQNAKIIVSGAFVIAFGQDPLNTANTLAYVSVDAVTWSNRTSLQGITVVAVAASGTQFVYYATTTGLYVQDLSNLIDGEPVINLVDVEADTALSQTIIFNDVCADNVRVVAAVQDGSYWTSTNGENFIKSESGLNVIHKSRLFDGVLWLFSRNLVKIEEVSQIMQLSTGEVLI